MNKSKLKTTYLVFPDHHGRLLGKHFLGEAPKSFKMGLRVLATDIPYATYTENFDIPNWEEGHGDFRLIPDSTSTRDISWLSENSHLTFCDLKNISDDSSLELAPREILKAQMANSKEVVFKYSKISSSYDVSIELEYHISSLINSENDWKDKMIYNFYYGMELDSFNRLVMEAFSLSDIPIISVHAEGGVGLNEINVSKTAPLKAADDYALAKHCLKYLAKKHNKTATFMAKKADDSSTSSSHIHISLCEDNKNLFVGTEEYCGIKCSNLLKHFIAGVITYGSDFMPLFAPTINSYKRFCKSHMSVPVNLSVGVDNRSAALRIVDVGTDNIHLEWRVPGSDANPYLSIAALIAAGTKGIERNLEPPDISYGNCYKMDLEKIPLSLESAVAKFRNSSVVKSCLGEKVTNHYVDLFHNEVLAFQEAVTDWEKKRYYEQI